MRLGFFCLHQPGEVRNTIVSIFPRYFINIHNEVISLRAITLSHSAQDFLQEFQIHHTHVCLLLAVCCSTVATLNILVVEHLSISLAAAPTCSCCLQSRRIITCARGLCVLAVEKALDEAAGVVWVHAVVPGGGGHQQRGVPTSCHRLRIDIMVR